VDPLRWVEHAAAYRDGIAPLVQAGQLAAVLVQLPPLATVRQQTVVTLPPFSMSWRASPWL